MLRTRPILRGVSRGIGMGSRAIRGVRAGVVGSRCVGPIRRRAMWSNGVRIRRAIGRIRTRGVVGWRCIWAIRGSPSRRVWLRGAVRAIGAIATRIVGIYGVGVIRASPSRIAGIHGVGGSLITACISTGPLAGMNDSAIVESAGSWCGRHIRPAVVHRGELRTIRSCSLLMLSLHTGHLDVVFPGYLPISGRLTRPDATSAAVVAHTGRSAVDDPGVIGVVNDGHIDVIHGAIVGEMPMIPSSAKITHADVSKTVVDAAIEPDVRSPVTSAPAITTVTPAPIPRSPEHADGRSQHPGAGYPVIVIVAIGPIPGRPDVTLSRTWRLFINGNFGRRDSYRDADTDLSETCRWYHEHRCYEKQRSDGMDRTHSAPFPSMLRLPAVR
jgi:hypothetical protein